MKKSAKFLSVLASVAIVLPPVPVYPDKTDTPKVTVIVENGTLSEENGAKWEGMLLSGEVEIGEGDNALTAFTKAIEENGLSQQGAEFGFVSEINGLGSEQGGAWMATLNDWFTDEGLSAYTVENGKLSDGDEIRFMYTLNWGADLGYDWTSTDTTLSEITFDTGRLEPEFSPDVTEYTLELNQNVVRVVPKASSKSFPVKIYKNEYTADKLGTDYKKNEDIQVYDGDTIIIGVANSNWMSYIPDGVAETVYKIDISWNEEISSEPSESEEPLETEESEVSNDTEESEVSDDTEESVVYSDVSDTEYSFAPVESEVEISEIEVSESIEDKMTVEELRKQYTIQQSIYGNEWGMITLAKFDFITDGMKESYAESVKEYLDSIGTAKISSTRSTAVSGVVLALSGMGENVYDFYGYNLLEPLSDMDYITNQGINGAMYALMAFDMNAEYYIPKAPEGVNQTTREKLIAEILNAQGEDGGWSFDVGNKSDADMTGIALQALAPYKDNESVKPAIEKALAFLSENQGENGGFTSYGSQDSESCSQVIAGLTMLGIDVLTDSRFIKDGNTAFDMLMRYYRDNGKFAHYEDGEENAISTSQAYYAIAVMYESKNGKADKPVFEEPSTVSEPSKENSNESSKEPSETVLQNSVESSTDNNMNNAEDNVKTDTSKNANNGLNSSNNAVSTSNNHADNSVATGDNENIILLFGAGMISASVIFALAKKKKED